MKQKRFYISIPSYQHTLQRLEKSNMGAAIGVALSSFLHASVILLVLFGLPYLWPRKPAEEYVMTVELVSVSKNTNLRPKFSEEKASKAEEKPAAVSQQQEKPAPKAKPEPEAPHSDPKQEQPKPAEPEKAKNEKSNDKATPPAPPKAKPKQRPKPAEADAKDPVKDISEFDSLLKDLEAAAKSKSELTKEEKDALKEPEDNSPKAKNSKDFNPDQELSVSFKDSIRSQLAQCWTINSGGQDVGGMYVILHISFAENGTVTSIVNTGGSDRGMPQFYRAFVDSALRAVQKCSPLQNLPVDLYPSWKEIEFTFDPREMIY